MDTTNLSLITSALAPVVMVSAAGLLFSSIQTKNLHLADRIAHWSSSTGRWKPQRVGPRAGSRSQRNSGSSTGAFASASTLLELLSLALLCFVVTSLFLVLAARLGAWMPTLVIAGIFVVGVALLSIALVVEFLEMRLGLRTIGIEIEGALDAPERRALANMPCPRCQADTIPPWAVCRTQWGGADRPFAITAVAVVVLRWDLAPAPRRPASSVSTCFAGRPWDRCRSRRTGRHR